MTKLQRDKTRKELLNEVARLKKLNTNYSNRENTRMGQVRHFRIRLYKIRNDIDYLLVPPWSDKSAYNKKPYKKKLKEAMKNGKI